MAMLWNFSEKTTLFRFAQENLFNHSINVTYELNSIQELESKEGMMMVECRM